MRPGLLADQSITLVTHGLYNGVPHDLKRFLIENKCGDIWFISHDFASRPTRISRLEHYKKGIKVLEKNTRDYKMLPEVLINIKDLLITFYWLKFNIKKSDIYFGFGAINTLAGILLKKSCALSKVIFYTIDFVPKRFNNSFLNNIYHRIDKFAVRRSTQTWNLSPKMAEGRKLLFGISAEEYPQKVVPVGIWLKDIKLKNFNEINKHELIFVGILLEKQGVHLVLQAIPQILKTIPDFKFRIIGNGEYEYELKKICSDLGIENSVLFEGAIYDQNEVNKKLGLAGIAAAMYDKEKDTFTLYADPTKLKTYLANGLPIILTDVPYNAKEIEMRGAGKVIEYDYQPFANAVIELMENPEVLKEYRTKAAQYAKQFDWNVIFNREITGLL